MAWLEKGNPPSPPNSDPVKEDPCGSWRASHYHVDRQGGHTVSRTEGAIASPADTAKGINYNRGESQVFPPLISLTHPLLYLFGEQGSGGVGWETRTAARRFAAAATEGQRWSSGSCSRASHIQAFATWLWHCLRRGAF